MTVNYKEVLESAQQLSPEEQVELAQTLLEARPTNKPMPLTGLSRHELQVLADAIMAPEHQAQLTELLERNRQEILPSHEKARLDNLLDEVDQIALLKARAMYTLKTMEASES